MTVDWSPELTLNQDLLDLQHVDLFRRLADAAAALDGARPSLEAAVESFADALVAHLAVEERLMEETLYPERIRHRSAHEMFVADLSQMRAELRAHGPTPVIADWIRTRIPEWLRFHIRVNDLPFGDYLARRRKQQPADARLGRDGGRRLS
jgi:hemerythrin-like metal-binding protein